MMAENVYVETTRLNDCWRWKSKRCMGQMKIEVLDFFLGATGANGKEDTVKVWLLLNHIGDEGIESFSNIAYLPEGPDPDDENRRLSAVSKDDYATVIRKFDEFFNWRDLQLMLREQCWLHLQREPSQTFDSWVGKVKEKSKCVQV